MQFVSLTVQGSGVNTYVISVDVKSGKAKCTCPAFKYSKARAACKHIKFAAAALSGSPAAQALTR